MPPPSEQELFTSDPSDGTDVVCIMLGGLKKVVVHTHLLASHSVYFRRVGNQVNPEYFYADHCPYATEQTISFFVQWIYGRTLGPSHLNEGLQKLCRRQQYETLMKSWVFGEKMGATEFQRDIMRCIAEDTRTVNLEISADIWIDMEVVAPSSKLRPFLAAMCCEKLHSSDANTVNMFLSAIPRSMLEEVTRCRISGPRRLQMDMELGRYLE
ncbi:hypothetical protein F5Y00DRAFT_266074 [Daldinia vernicosa]|uniref:uncharacterized protein n=1 Tax=Daldinia vernicosa TaxID=114800 RepID=UPI00200856CD|nr:uncharacterized protein F5Y00DRAFT_266074 [Daldinia vernicosa]KAI0844979.1 hypothetical protein F5Y00DRAFT_266074 [Daldinia vernicosa]